MPKRALQVAGVLIVILLLAALSLRFLINANEFRPQIEAAATSAVGRKVSLGDLSFSIFSGSLKAQDLSIADDPRFGTEPFFRAKSLALGVNVRQLLRSRTIAITDLTIDDAEIALIENAAGEWNFSSALSKGSSRGVVRPVSTAGAPLDFLARLVSINNSRVSVTQPGGNQKPLVLEKVDIALKEFSPEGGFPFSLTAKLDPAGDIKLDGNVGKIPADSFLTPVQVNMKITNVDLATVGMIASEGVSGVISIDGSANLEANMLDTKGQLRIEHAKLARLGVPSKQPLEFDFTVRHNMQTRSGVLSQGAVLLGKAPVSISGGYAETGTVMKVDLRVAGSAIPINSAIAILPSLGVQLPSGSSLEGGTLSMNLAATGAVSDPTLAGTVSLTNTRLKGFDLGAKLSTIERLAGIHATPDTAIQTLSAGVRSGPGGTTIQNLKLNAPAIGELDGAGTISAKRDLDFKMRVTLQKEGVFQLAMGNSVPFFVRGNVASPQIIPDVASIAASELNRPAQVVTGLGGLFGVGKKKQK
jgi:AsmA protein